jgi:hypothetical protein
MERAGQQYTDFFESLRLRFAAVRFTAYLKSIADPERRRSSLGH